MFHPMRYEGIFTPPSEQGTLVFPGNLGTVSYTHLDVYKRQTQTTSTLDQRPTDQIKRHNKDHQYTEGSDQRNIIDTEERCV